ncbi:hypothetical protein Pcinc_033894 [Petrolisthes cinctipes]|uniref:Serum response factor n=1 Tax=Petrolisthes cinctipes TaxID=88211 RepID=A0AAE1ERH9_PETCI|nr:hypothetical protein Pcinc_033894 [Petrolisthes cinctipes]
MLLVASETGHVYTFATRKLQPMITSEAGKALIQTCLNSPDPPQAQHHHDQRMSATGFEETELTYAVAEDEHKVRQMMYSTPINHMHQGSVPSPSHHAAAAAAAAAAALQTHHHQPQYHHPHPHAPPTPHLTPTSTHPMNHHHPGSDHQPILSIVANVVEDDVGGGGGGGGWRQTAGGGMEPSLPPPRLAALDDLSVTRVPYVYKVGPPCH